MRTILLALLIPLAAPACHKRGADAGHGHSHGPGGHSHSNGEDHDSEKMAQITAWSSGYEIFAEHPAPVAGRPVRVVTHISDLSTGLPRKSGMVRFVLTRGSDQFEHPQAGPRSPGIYVPGITFPSAGEWNMAVSVPGRTNAVISLGSIAVFENPEAAARASFPEAPEGISFLKEQQWRIAMKAVPAARRPMTQRIALPATIIPAPGHRAAVHPPVQGVITRVEMVPGQQVREGDVLAWIQPVFSEFTAGLISAEAEAIRARAQAEQAAAHYERVKRLHEQRAKSDRELQEAELERRSAQASFDAAAAVQAQYRRSGATLDEGGARVALKSPINGTVERIFYHSGERVEPEQPVFSIIDLATVWVEASVAPDRLRQISPDAEAFFQLPAAEFSESLRLELVSVGRVLDPLTRMATVLYRTANHSGLAAGSFGKVLAPTGVSTNAIAVLASSIVEDDGIPVVFVQLSGETFDKRDITTGIQEQGWVEVKSGVAEGERVVSEGAYPLLLSTKAGTIPAHGHAH